MNLIPWLTVGGVGSTQCPLDPDIIQRAVTAAAEADPILAFDDLCADCKFKGMGLTCRARIQYLIDKYGTDPTEAKTAVIKEDNHCKKKNQE